MIKKFINYYKPHWKLFTLDIISALLISVADLIYPMVTRNFINNIIPNKEIGLIFQFGLFLVALYLVRMLLEYIVGYYGHVLGVRMEYDMRKDIFAHVQKLSFNYYDNTKTGHLMSRIVNDLLDISEIAHHGPEDLFISTIRIVGAFTLLMFINVELTLIVFAIVPFMFLFMIIYNKKLKKVFGKLRESVADINGNVEDSISGIRVVKSFTNESYEIDKFNRGNDRYKRIRASAVRHIGIFDAVIHFFSNLAIVITLVAGGYFVSVGRINIGDLVAYLIYIALFLEPLRILARFIEQYQLGMAGFRRFVEILNTEPDIKDKENAVVLSNVEGKVELKDVTFRYNNEAEVLTNVNLTVNPGETIAIVGASGAGKTTLSNLLPRFYDVDDGSIKIDNIDIRDVTQDSLRRNIGIVQQDVFLFSGTIKENVMYGNIDATDEEIIKATKAANAHDFILEMPDGYNTYIGERGVKLSGGQKQRISIARMFLKNPSVLILDEATSSLDNQSEAIIQQSIEKLTENRTTFIIAHRLGTIRNAERIIVLSDNGIDEDGPHKELIAKKGTYYKLYNSQFESMLIG